jgi:uncharacterized protein (DUF1501 family)
VIPYPDNAYHDARPDLAYAPQDVLHLDDRLGLNPALRGLSQAWADKTLAIVRGVSYPKPDHSHFRSMDIWQTASPAEPMSTGWIGRWLDATGDDPLRAVNIGSVLPPLAVGEKCTAAALSPAGGTHAAEPYTAVITALGAEDPHDTPAMAAVRSSCRATEHTDAAFRKVGAPGTSTNTLAKQLDVVAKCVQAGLPTRVYIVQLGGFDTHADERDTQQRLLQTFDEAPRSCCRWQPTGTARTLWCWLIRSSGDGSQRMCHTAPTTVRRAPCSSQAPRRAAASTVTSPV